MIQNWRKCLAVATVVGSAFIPWTTPSVAASRTTQTQKFPSASFSETTVAQSAQTCRVVGRGGGLYVRSRPTAYSEAITILPQGSVVTVTENPDFREYVPITNPMNGYVFSGFLNCQVASNFPTPQTEQTPTPSSSSTTVARSPQTCRVTGRGGGLYVRSGPSVYTEAIATLPLGTLVTVTENPGFREYVPITEPQNGYVFSGFLNCYGAAVPSSPLAANPTPSVTEGMCREVSARRGLNVRRRPTTHSEIVNVLGNNQTVTVVDTGLNGWVQISQPNTGYVWGNYLTTCR